MSRTLFVLALLFSLSSSAATISSSTCPGTGCSLSYVPDTPAVSLNATGTWLGTVAVELSADAVTFRTARAYPVGGGTYTDALTANGSWLVPTEGLVYLRLRATSWTSGTATVTLRHSSALPAVDVVRVVGPTFGEVAVSGTVDLGTASLSSLVAPECSLPSAPPVVALTTTTQDVPAVPLAGRTQALVINHSSVQRVWCCIGTGCTPTSTAAYVLAPGGGSRVLTVRDSVPIRCRAAVGTADVGVEESSCG
jgi:hypothetical protein